ncbi:hypothetical protein CRG98_013511 [Punica granatum]|uniref:Uncharacterized protein n=1 Tax=Punica granatum TaxID=22663 RepID=A0A2I0KDA4_PUNGR|nr:hypothetical protein CRG98_013511 [Punica granatum]
MWFSPIVPLLRGGNQQNPFSMVYEFEAVLPAKIGLHTYRVEVYNEDLNDGIRAKELDNLKGLRLKVADFMTRVKDWAAKYFNRKVKARQFTVEDWVLRKNELKRLSHAASSL